MRRAQYNAAFLLRDKTHSTEVLPRTFWECGCPCGCCGASGGCVSRAPRRLPSPRSRRPRIQGPPPPSRACRCGTESTSAPPPAKQSERGCVVSASNVRRRQHTHTHTQTYTDKRTRTHARTHTHTHTHCQSDTHERTFSATLKERNIRKIALKRP